MAPDPRRPTETTPWRWLFAALIGLFLSSSAGITSSNDGSHFALVSALVETHSLTIDRFVGLTKDTDLCFKGGHYYSDRPPGTALAAAPLYILGKIAIFAHLSHALCRHGAIREDAVLLLPAAAGALTVYLMAGMLVRFGTSHREALLLSVAAGFSTPIWVEASRLFSHGISMAAVLLAVWLAITSDRCLRRVVWAAAALGFASIAEIQNVLFVIPLSAYLLFTGRLKGPGGVKCAAISLAVFCGVLAILLVYNYAAFGEISLKSNRFNPHFPEENSMSSALHGNAAGGINRLLFTPRQGGFLTHWDRAIRNGAPGIFVMSPIVLACIPGFWVLLKKARPEALLMLSIVALDVGVAAAHKTVLPRHISTIIPLLAIAAAVYISRSLQEARDSRRRFVPALLAALLIGVFVISVCRVFYVMHTNFGRSFADVLKPFTDMPGLLLAIALIACAGFAWRAHKDAKDNPARSAELH